MESGAGFWREGVKRWRIAQWTAFFASAAAALAYSVLLARDVSYKIALDYAGDFGLPNWRLYQSAADIHAFAAHLSAGAKLSAGAHAYGLVLGLGNGLAAVTLAAFLSVAWLAWRNAPGWASALAAAALLYAVTDWTALAMLGESAVAAGSGVAAQTAPYGLAAFTATAKSLLFVFVCLPLAAAGLAFALGTRKAWWFAIFMDLPYLIDRGWRRLEFRLNQEFVNEPGPALTARRFWQVPPFWLFALTLLFTAYGPTPSGLCSVEPDTVSYGLAVFSIAAMAALAYAFFWKSVPRLRRHVLYADLPDMPGADLAQRRHISYVIFVAAVASFYVLGLWAAHSLFVRAQGDLCEGIEASGDSLWRLAICAAALALYAAAWSSMRRTAALLRLQAILIVAVALAIGFLLGGADATEASGRPYLHLFLALAPATCVLLWLALAIAERGFGKDLEPLAAQFRARLAETELFVAPPEAPVPTWERIVHGLLHDVFARFFELTLLACMVAVIAPRQWLWEMTSVAFLISIAVSTWGNMSARWQQIGQFIERWFLTGTAFFVSIFVIALAAARLYGVSYVTTLLDAAPFGVIFTGVVMTYLLSWLLEYWINRSAATELLRMLGARDGASWARYPFTGRPALKVEQGNRYLAYQAIGRFAVIGRLEGSGRVAFHTYGLIELLHALAGEALRDHANVVQRRLQLYFYQVNGLLAAAVLGLALSYGYFYNFAEQIAVVSAPASVEEARLTDLAEQLLERPGDARPALVIAASGGGTRAALYTSYVLEALHAIGVDRDIKLASGVSGGGVALAYFVAHFRRLTREDEKAARRWEKFRTAAAENFVDDVLSGASEWRIFGPAPLTLLLAESFERRLFGDTRRKTFDLPDAPALILNTTLTGHPEEDSALLRRTLDRPAAGRGCVEATRPYKSMEGGRLIFTNLRQIGEFPTRDSELVDVRLPYRIVRGPDIRLSHAAALNANFPPVFPNARVFVEGAGEDDCADRSYFVTDGGVQENLGFVSALFAVKSALRAIAERCAKEPRHAWCQRGLRPIHFILIEASATGYDYAQDRGVSALGGGKERMTGAATGLLIEQTNMIYSGLKRAQPEVKKMRLHFVGLPLAYRARGGFGTHWTHPDPIELSDPRSRTAPLPALLSPLSHATMSRHDVGRAWRAFLHPDIPYCEGRGLGTLQANTVLRWICGDRGDPRAPRDLTVLTWRDLVKELRPAAAPQP